MDIKSRVIFRTTIYVTIMPMIGYFWTTDLMYLAIILLALSGFILNDSELNTKTKVKWWIYSAPIIFAMAFVLLVPWGRFKDDQIFRSSMFALLGIDGAFLNWIRYHYFTKERANKSLKPSP